MMTSSAFIDRVSTTLGIQRRDMIEKDILLHSILLDLSRDKFFFKNFVIKGGTCLIKYYQGYFRFSEDIDFTWKNQDRFKRKTAKAIRRDLSTIIDETGRIFEAIAAKRGLDFKCKKNNTRYIELGGSSKTCTFKIWYDSETLKKNTFIKVQINFVEEMCQKPRKGQLKSLLTASKNEELAVLFPEHYSEYSITIPFFIYNIGDLLSEKIRAVLTREGVKARDFLDIFFISKDLSIKPSDVEKCVIAKMNYALKLYQKYRTNLKEKVKLLKQKNIFEWGTERELLLITLDEKDFYSFINEVADYLDTLIKKF